VRRENVGQQFTHYVTHPTSHELEAFDPKADDVVGYMRWSKETGQIQDISVPKRFQRQGIATSMWNYAKDLAKNSDGSVISPIHSPVRTPEGAAWARKVGD
jgi:ribosomal protein S18 acetylase RimI-like enzyme